MNSLNKYLEMKDMISRIKYALLHPELLDVAAEEDINGRIFICTETDYKYEGWIKTNKAVILPFGVSKKNLEKSIELCVVKFRTEKDTYFPAPLWWKEFIKKIKNNLIIIDGVFTPDGFPD